MTKPENQIFTWKNSSGTSEKNFCYKKALNENFDYYGKTGLPLLAGPFNRILTGFPVTRENFFCKVDSASGVPRLDHGLLSSSY